ncbi:LptF/LptG family permease [Ahrensia sp. R2A130]|uniref:LptF/LptG family permease n=1 Tax=Ahrensia sp. R2A130 TaxID=744979 RepID=UPI0001E09430|nr:LptF/LptG family permease [Ahrensia sp. R2A130]EFL90593.1 permease [Ahrensia sp. R2A130]
MIGQTLSVYLAKNFLRNTMFVFLVFFFLIALVDMLELSRRTARIDDVGFFDVVSIVMLRAPVLSENIVPFAVLFGASASLLLLNKRLELVVARASGVSVWQFLAPICAAAAVVGLVMGLIYNPLSLRLQASSLSLEGVVFAKNTGVTSDTTWNFWTRIARPDGDMVLRAAVAAERGKKLSGVSLYLFDKDGKPEQRIDAASANFAEAVPGTDSLPNRYVLERANILTVGEKPKVVPVMVVPVSITAELLEIRQTSAERVSFWDLDDQAELAERAGRPPEPFQTRWHSVLALPLLFVAMVLLAGTVSLTFARFGINGKRILTGVVAGFVLYVLTKLVVTFGSNGLVSPVIAAWSPATVGSLIAITVLLHQEDG